MCARNSIFITPIGSISGENSIFRLTQFDYFGDKRVGEMCMAVIIIVTVPYDLLRVNHSEPLDPIIFIIFTI